MEFLHSKAVPRRRNARKLGWAVWIGFAGWAVSLPSLAQQSAPLPVHPNGRKTLRAVRISAPIKLDGDLSESVWQEVEPANQFVQAEPYEGTPATEATDVKVLYSDENLYIGVYCHDQEPGRVLVNSSKEDFDPKDDDSFEIILDTFLDSRNGYLFITNPLGAKRDAQVTDDGRNINSDWDTVWDVRAQKTGDGWTAEIVIPFKSLSFDEHRAGQLWGINFARRIRRKNEIVYWSPLPRRYDITRLSLAGELQGLAEIERGRNLRIKPFAVTDLGKFARVDHVNAKLKGGLDAKYNITPSLTLDLTGNTDFSQVEVDEQQINLTRFPLFFPEKREFFLENSGIFQFGDIPLEHGTVRSRETQLFFSRRIGLSENGEPLPIWGGARLSGQVGKFALGVLTMQTKDAGGQPGNNFSVARFKRDILSNSDIGAVFINRQASAGKDFNRTVGADGNFRFGQNLSLNGYLARTMTDGLHDQDFARKISTQWKDNVLTFHLAYTDLEENFNPEVGFAERTGVHTVRNRIELHLRPFKNRVIREFRPHTYPNFFMDTHNRILTKGFHYGWDVVFHNGATAEVKYETNFDRLDQPFRIHPIPPLVTIPVGDYYFNQMGFEIISDPSRKLSGSVNYLAGEFYSGDKATLTVSGTFRPSFRFAAEGRYIYNNVELREGSFATHLLSSRASYYFSTRMFLTALIQYNSDRKQVSSNIRFNFIHRPLSDLFIVYNELRDVSAAHRNDKAVSLKYTHLISF